MHCIHSVTHVYLPKQYMPGTLLDQGDTAMNKINAKTYNAMSSIFRGGDRQLNRIGKQNICDVR